MPRTPQHSGGRNIVEIDARTAVEHDLDSRSAGRTPAPARRHADAPPIEPLLTRKRASPARSPSGPEGVAQAAASRRPPQPAKSARPIAPGALRAHCEVDGRAVELEPAELNPAGLFVRTPEPLPAGRDVEVRLRVDTLQLTATGHVFESISVELATKRQRAPGYALLFMHVDERSRAQLRAALEQDAPAAEPAVKPAAPSVDPKEREVLATLQAELAAVRPQTPWAILGLPQGADRESARQAFFAASKRYHPHLFASYTLPEIKQTVTELFIVYKRAFTSMTKPVGSARPVARSAAPGTPNHG